MTIATTPSPAGAPAVRGSQNGWYIVTLANGDYGLVRWLNNAWQWTGVTPPKAAVTSAMFAGSSYADIGNHPAQWGHLLSQLPTTIQSAMWGLIDAGPITRGQATLIDASGRSVNGSGAVGSDATLEQGIPGANAFGKIKDPLSELIALLTDPHTWIRFAELIGGIALVLMGLRSLTGTATTPVSVIQSAGKKAAMAAAA